MNAKLTPEIAAKIRQLKSLGVARKDIAYRLAIDYSHVCAILRGEYWKVKPH